MSSLLKNFNEEAFIVFLSVFKLTCFMIGFYLTYGIVILLYAVLIVFVLLKVRGRDMRRPEDTLMLLLPSLTGVILLSSDMAYSISLQTMPFSDVLSTSVILLLVYCRISQRCAVSSVFILITVLLMVCFSASRIYSVLTGTGCQTCALLRNTSVAAVSVVFVFAFVEIISIRLKSGRRKTCMEKSDSHSHLFLYMIMVFSMTVISQYCQLRGDLSGKVSGIVLTAISVTLYLAIYIDCLRISGVLVSGKRAKSVSGPPVCGTANDSSKDTFRELFRRIAELFENEKPYLDESVTVGEIARRLFTNKVYISRAINEFTGKNFCQYVNYYRIMYSMQLFDENPYLRVSELADMSGFHSLVSYNMAFRLVMNESPGEWCRRRRTQIDRSVKRLKAVEADHAVTSGPE